MNRLALLFTTLIFSFQVSAEVPNPVKVGVALGVDSFVSLNDGTYSGLEAEIVQAICDENKWNCEYSEANFLTVFDDVLGFTIEDGKPNLNKPIEKKYDIVIGALDAASDRLEYMDFSQTYFSGRHLFMRAPHVKSLQIQQPSGFPVPKSGETLKIAVEEKSALNGELFSFYSHSLINKINNVEIVNFNANKEGFEKLKTMISNKDVDLVFTFSGSSVQNNATDMNLTPATPFLGVVDTSILRGVGIGMARPETGENLLKEGADKTISRLLNECKNNEDCSFNQWKNSFFPNLPFDPNPAIVPEVKFSF